MLQKSKPQLTESQGRSLIDRISVGRVTVGRVLADEVTEDYGSKGEVEIGGISKDSV